MSDYFFLGKSWYDRRIEQRVDDLERSLLSSQRSETRRLKAQLTQVQGSLEQRVTRLAAAFDAFVELSDLREELQPFQPALMVRHHARRLLAELADDGTSPAPIDPIAGDRPATGDRFDDVPGYWLGPACAALAATLHGDTTAAESSAATAMERDPARATAFLCVGLVLADRPELAVGRLGPLIELRPGEPITRCQRLLWHAAADGVFGDAGRALLAERLRRMVEAEVRRGADGSGGSGSASRSPGSIAVDTTGTGEAGTEARTPGAGLDLWRALVDGLASSGRSSRSPGRRGTGIPDVYDAPVRAAARLEALRAWCEQRLAPVPERSEPGAAAESESPDGQASRAPLVALIEELIDEGAPGERALLERVVHLRSIVESDDGRPPPPPVQWDDAVGDPVAVLHTEATEGATTSRRAVALRAAAPLLLSVGDQLVREARRPVPDEVEVSVGRHRIRYGPRGADPFSVTQAQEALAATPSRPPRNPAVGAAVAGAGVLLVPVGAIAGAGALVALGIVVAVAGAAMGLIARSDAQRAEEIDRADRTRLDEDIARTADVIAELRVRAARAVDEATATRQALDAALTSSSPSNSPP